MRLSAIFIAVTSAFTLACMGGDKLGRGDDTAPEGDSEGGGGGGGGGLGGVCGAYSGVAGVGTRWEFNYQDGQGGGGDYLIEVTSIDGDRVEQVSSLSMTSADFSYSSETTSQYRCDGEGMFILSSTTDYTSVVAGQSYSGWTESTFTGAALILPRQLEVGLTWVSDQSYTYVDSSGSSDSFDVTFNFEVSAEEDVTVPAGTYTALRVESDGAEHGSHYTKGVGFIRSSYFELVRYTK